MKSDPNPQRGFAAIAAIFLLVVLAALGGFMVTFSNTQQLTSAQDLQGLRAYWAARAGLAWGVASVMATPVVPANCPVGAAPSATACPTGAPAKVEGFTLVVNCSCAAYTDGANPVRLFRFQAQASLGAAGTANYIERSVSASLER